MPKVSVCIPSYNYAHYIGASVESVLNQTFADWELLIVDNHSTDSTNEVLQAFLDPRIKVFRNERNIGLLPNWNRSVALSQGEYVCVLPADDLLLPTMLERSVALLDSYPKVGFTFSSCQLIDTEGRIFDTMRTRTNGGVISGLELLKSLTMFNYILSPTVLMRQTCYRQLGGYGGRYELLADWSLYMRAALSHDVAYIDEPQACFRFEHPGSHSARRFLKNPRLALAEELSLLEEVFRHLPKNQEWKRIESLAYRQAMDRHVDRTMKFLPQGQGARFRTEIAYAARRDPAFALRYRKVMVLWVASLVDARLATWLDSFERSFWRILRGPISETHSARFLRIGGNLG